MRSSWITWVSPKSNDSCARQRRQRKRTDEEIQEAGCVRMEVETGVVQLQVKEHHVILTATRSWSRPGTESPLEPPEGQFCQHLTSNFSPPELGENEFLLG